MTMDNFVKDIWTIKSQMNFSGVPITDTGAVGGKLLGFCSQRDIDFLSPAECETKRLKDVSV